MNYPNRLGRIDIESQQRQDLLSVLVPREGVGSVE
jgi:hypothetical protein